ncbi:MAG: HEAT repeat domain-containing protein [Planctomycetaceae bacterium]|nr:HEAT repeat domain-containing protein [Planctomycetaceae bacterium]
MRSAGGRRLLLSLFGLIAVASAGCADLDWLPSWVPFQGPASDPLPGVKTPAERISDLRKLCAGASNHGPAEKLTISEELAVSMRDEKDPLIRVEIIRTLGYYPSPSADAILKAALSDTDREVRVASCEAWGRRTDNGAVALLVETLKGDVDSDVRLAAARALGETRNAAAVPALGEAVSDSDPAMQYRAVLALEKITGKDLGQNVQRWQNYIKEGQPHAVPTLSERVRSWF